MKDFYPQIELLKQTLISEDDFGKIFSCFFSQLGEDAEFIRLGKKAKVPVLKQGFKKIGQQLFQEATVTKLLSTYVKKYNFYHGSCFIASRPATFFFFGDIDMGMVGIIQSMHSHMMSFIRLTSYTFEGDNLGTMAIPGTNSIQ